MKSQQLYQESIKHKEEFWREQAQNIRWFEFPKTILSQDENGYPTWFADGKLNMSYLCIDQHIEDGFGDQIAVIYDSPVTGKQEKFTYNQLKEQDDDSNHIKRRSNQPGPNISQRQAFIVFFQDRI